MILTESHIMDKPEGCGCFQLKAKDPALQTHAFPFLVITNMQHANNKNTTNNYDNN